MIGRAGTPWAIPLCGCIVLACSQGSGGSGGAQANPCATKGATYQLMFSEKSGGTCGPWVNFPIDVGTDGTLQPYDGYLTCSSQQVTGCATHASNCMYTMNNTMCTITLELAFSSDGSTATGTDSVSCFTQGQTCASSYLVSGARQ
jgi:hypothetical protein